MARVISEDGVTDGRNCVYTTQCHLFLLPCTSSEFSPGIYCSSFLSFACQSVHTALLTAAQNRTSLTHTFRFISSVNFSVFVLRCLKFSAVPHS